MTAVPGSTSAIPIDPRIRVIAAGIAAAIPEAQVRLFGSRARGTSRPDYDDSVDIRSPDWQSFVQITSSVLENVRREPTGQAS